MSISVQLERCLRASAFVATLVVAPRAFADPPASGSAIPRAREPIVKLFGPRNFERLVLTQPTPNFSPGPERTEKRILGLRLPAFIALGLGGLGAGGAIATGMAANSRGNDPSTCDNRCNDHTISTRSLYVTTGVLAGVAAAGVGLGVAFMIGTPSRNNREDPRPTLGFNVSSQKAVARVRWRF